MEIGVGEWVAILALAIGLLGHIIKVYADHKALDNRVNSVEKWQEKVNNTNLITFDEYSRGRLECRTELYKDITKLENRFESFLRTLETSEKSRRENEDSLRNEIRQMRDSIVRIVTLLEEKKLDVH